MPKPKRNAKAKIPTETAVHKIALAQDDIFERSPYRIAFHVHDVSRMRKTLIDQILRPHGVTRSQWWVLANLARNRSRSLSQVELGRLLDMGKASVGTLIQALEKSGLVARVPAPDDARAKQVMLTNEGLKKLQGMTDITQPTNDRIVDGISQKDMDVAIRVLSTMKHNLKTIFEESEEI